LTENDRERPAGAVLQMAALPAPLPMPAAHYRRVERRRSARVTLSVPLRVDGQDLSGEGFVVETHTHTVSQHGCLLRLDREVLLGQSLVLMNQHTRQSIQARVVSTRRHKDGHRYIGVEFISRRTDFWRITFSKPGAKSLKRY
jgi:c-di-GMP-binding flagellar brake protein YcgR